MPALTLTVRVAGDRTVVSIRGVVDEDVDLAALASLTGRVEVDLSGVRRFNSTGVRNWVDAVRPLGERAQVTFVGCSSAVVFQLNMISGFLGRGRVESFFAPMRCEPCNAELDHLFRRTECEDGLPPVRCATCSRHLELDDDEDQYLLFLREPTLVV